MIGMLACLSFSLPVRDIPGADDMVTASRVDSTCLGVGGDIDGISLNMGQFYRFRRLLRDVHKTQSPVL